MLDPLDSENRTFLNTLSRRRRKALFALTLERITLHFWRLFFWVLLFMGLWMLEIPQFFGLVGKSITTLIFLGGVIYFLRRDVRCFALPEKKVIDSRLEAETEILQGSIQALEDRLANPKKHITRDLWDRGQKQILETLRWMRVPKPAAILVRKDPYALRFLAVLVFLSGLFVAGPDWSARLWDGFLPVTPKFALLENKSVNLWIKPPQYTGIPQIHVIGSSSPKEGLSIPESSQIKTRVYSPMGKFLSPHLTNGNKTEPMKYLGEGLYSYEGTIDRASSLSIAQGFFPRARWDYAYIDDLPPVINITKPEEQKEESAQQEKHSEEKKEEEKAFEITSGSQLRFFLTLKDDYSVENLAMTLALDPIVEEKPIGQAYGDERLVMSPANTDFKISPVYDLTWHTWSGLPVIITFTAKDHLNQTAALAPIKITLPERTFENPVAKSLIAIRKKLAWTKDYDFTSLSHELASLLKAKDFFKNNPVVYLAIKTASARLMQSETMTQSDKLETAKAVIDLLWDTALALDDGALALALRDLKEAQNAMENAMRDPNASDEDIARLMEDLQSKIQNYFAELQKDMQRRIAEGEEFPMVSPDQFGQMINPENMESFLQQLQSELQSGNKEKAQEMLSQLQRMMDMMDPSMNAPLPKDMQMMSEGVNELQKLIEGQEKLLEQTLKQSKIQNLLDMIPQKPSTPLPPDSEILKKFGLDDFPPPPKPQERAGKKDEADEGVNTQANKAEQEALRYVLGQLMMEAGEHLPEIPENMGKAEQEMRGSEKDLGANDPQSAIPHQEKAIENLKEAQKDLGEQLKKRMQQMVGIGLSGGMRYDPLGRPYGGKGSKDGPAGQDDVKIPNEAQKKRVDEILRLLRDRSGEFQRPQEELEYYRRLLRQF